MGMFDRIWFSCPYCQKPIEVQSKAGPCLLADFDNSAVPVGIADDIKDKEAFCEDCMRPFRVRPVNMPATVAMGLEEER